MTHDPLEHIASWLTIAGADDDELNQSAAIEFEAHAPEVYESALHTKCWTKTMRDLHVVMHTAAAVMCSTKPELVDSLGKLLATEEGRQDNLELLEAFTDAIERFKSLTKVLEGARSRALIALAAAAVAMEEDPGLQP